MGDALVVAPLGQGGNATALDLLGAHARHFEEGDAGACGSESVDAGLQVLGHVVVPLRAAELEVGAVVELEIEHVPGAEHDESDLGVGAVGGVDPLVLPPLTPPERQGVAVAFGLQRALVVDTAAFDRAVGDVECLLDAVRQVDRQGVCLRVTDDDEILRAGRGGRGRDGGTRGCRLVGGHLAEHDVLSPGGAVEAVDR